MKLRNIFMILASAALLTACDDVFTPAAENMKDINEMENDPIMAKGFVLTAYRNLPNYEVGTGTDVATDDAVTNEKGANWSKYATGSWTVQSWDYGPLEQRLVFHAVFAYLPELKHFEHRVPEECQ